MDNRLDFANLTIARKRQEHTSTSKKTRNQETSTPLLYIKKIYANLLILVIYVDFE